MKVRLHTKAFCIFLSLLILLGTLALPAGAEAVLLGDLDADGDITSADARVALRLAVELVPMDENYLAVGDADGDGSVTSADARKILRAAVDLEDFGGKTVEAEITSYDARFASLPTEIPPAPEINAKSGTFTFVTYGWGHCVGMSQQGAIIMGKAGFTYDEILAYYFTGTELVKDPAIPDEIYYCGEYYPTFYALTHMVSQEIGGDYTQSPESLKAQAVAIYTLLKYYNFKVKGKWDVAAMSSSSDKISEKLSSAVESVMGEYLVLEDDPDQKAVLSVYGDMCAGRTLSCKEAWGGGDYPVSVYAPFEAQNSDFIGYKTLTVSQMRDLIEEWNSDVKLSYDPADWIEILAHDGSLDENRGYVTSIRIGNKTLNGIGAFGNKVTYLRSPCFTVTYTP